MQPKYQYGDAVRLTRNVRNDGTFPGQETGAVLIRRGAIGYVRDVGTFLQDQLIYSVDFFKEQRLVGCREQELQGAEEPWIPNLFEYREQVTPKTRLSVGGAVIAEPGDRGEIEKVLREAENGPSYHVRFHGRTLLIAENVLDAFEGEAEE